MSKVLNVRGTNGSGKTTLVRSLLGPNSRLLKFPEGSVTESEEGSVIAIGPYVEGSYSGGCDRIRTTNDVQSLINRSLNRGASIILFEGIIVSTVFSTWLEFSKSLKNDGGTETVWVYLDTPLEVCLRRIQERNGGKPIKENLVADKYRSIDRTRVKAIAAGERVVTLNWEDAENQIRSLL